MKWEVNGLNLCGVKSFSIRLSFESNSSDISFFCLLRMLIKDWFQFFSSEEQRISYFL